MRSALLGTILLCIATSPAALADPDGGGLLVEGVPPEIQGRIDEAVNDGIRWLADDLRSALAAAADAPHDPSQVTNPWHTEIGRPGDIALRIFALAECGDESILDVVEAGFAYLREHHHRQEQFVFTYDVAINIMALEAYLSEFGGDREDAANREDLEWTARLAFWLASGGEKGSWSYGCPGFDEPETPARSRRNPYRVGGGSRHRRGETPPVRFSRPPPIPDFRETGRLRTDGTVWDFDNSNSQYAILGLKASRLLGIEFPPSLWTEIAEHWLDQQQEEGPEVALAVRREGGEVGTLSEIRAHARGFRYVRPDRAAMSSNGAWKGDAYENMTAAGLAGCCVVASELDDRNLQARVEQAIWDGLAWLQENYTIEAREAKYRLYYLYGIERAGVFAGVRTIGEHDWYIEGAEWLLAAQADDGSWPGATPFSRGTCFALLFLKRASGGFLQEYSVGPGR